MSAVNNSLHVYTLLLILEAHNLEVSKVKLSLCLTN
jgi:hypothetical protein